MLDFVNDNSRLTKAAICSFAGELGIAPGIVVGRLQHDGYLRHNYCNDLKIKFEWVKEND